MRHVSNNPIEYLSDKSSEEKKFVGKVFLSLTRDYAEQLLSKFEKKKDIDALEEMQKMLLVFSQRATPSV